VLNFGLLIHVVADEDSLNDLPVVPQQQPVAISKERGMKREKKLS
jgi:hypothetical protein